jgi:hypothetical protein
MVTWVSCPDDEPAPADDAPLPGELELQAASASVDRPAVSPAASLRPERPRRVYKLILVLS